MHGMCVEHACGPVSPARACDIGAVGGGASRGAQAAAAGIYKYICIYVYIYMHIDIYRCRYVHTHTLCADISLKRPNEEMHVIHVPAID